MAPAGSTGINLSVFAACDPKYSVVACAGGPGRTRSSQPQTRDPIYPLTVLASWSSARRSPVFVVRIHWHKRRIEWRVGKGFFPYSPR